MTTNSSLHASHGRRLRLLKRLLITLLAVAAVGTTVLVGIPGQAGIAHAATSAVPTVTSISPTSGAQTGGTSVTITGTGLTGATEVDFGTTAATDVVVNGDTSITAVSPAGTGTVNVTVITPGGTSTGTAGQFAYTDPDFTLTVSSPVQNVADGQSVQFTVQRTAAGTAAGVEIKAAVTGWCEPSISLPVTETAQTAGNLGTLFGTGHFPVVSAPQLASGVYPCVGNVGNEFPPPLTAISPPVNTTPNIQNVAGDYPTVSGTAVAATGTASFTAPSGSTSTFQCDSTDPCTFAVAVYASDASDPATAVNTHVLGVPVTFLSSDSLNASCGGAAPGQINTIGDDRLNSAVSAWTLGACGAGTGGGKALTSNTSSQQTDATALCSFASGNSDLAYSSVGYGAAGFDPSTCSGLLGPQPARPYVAVPVALNAVVFAHTQTQRINALENPVVGPFLQPLKVTVSQLATLLSNGSNLSGAFEGEWNSSFGQALLAENPDLATDTGYNGTMSTLAQPIVATSGTEGTTLFTTGFLQALAPAADMMSNPSAAQGIVSQQLGVTSNFGIADPALYFVNTYTGSQAMIKDLTPPTSSWVLTDAASAAAAWGGQAEVEIQTPDSISAATPSYVTADPASMDAAVSEMTQQPDGTLIPNPNTTPVGGVEPYPLTYVEYAIVPTQPLLNPDCSPNTQGQQDLAAWLNYITGAGQSELPSGLVSLTPALQGQAAAAIAKVGQAAPACTPPPTTPAATPPATTSGFGSSSGFGSGSGFGDTGSSGFGSGSGIGGISTSFGASAVLGGSGTAPGSAGSAAAKKGGKPVAVQLARFTAHPGATWIGPLIGLLALAIVMPAFVLAASGASLSETLAGLGGWTWIRRRRRGPPAPGPG